jgi:hypothetical protein
MTTEKNLISAVAKGGDLVIQSQSRPTFHPGTHSGRIGSSILKNYRQACNIRRFDIDYPLHLPFLFPRRFLQNLEQHCLFFLHFLRLPLQRLQILFRQRPAQHALSNKQNWPLVEQVGSGANVGLATGAVVGLSVVGVSGTSVGGRVGAGVGSLVGELDGARVCLKLGIKVGAIAGLSVVGLSVGVLLGIREGFLLGIADGFLLGAEDGCGTGRGGRV